MAVKPILVVDDEKNIRETLCQALEPLHLDVHAAVNGTDALNKLQEQSYRLILLDLRMPGMDGMEVLRHVRKYQPDIRIIIITAHGTIESAVEAMKLGAVDFIQKPFTPKEIRGLVQRVLDREQIAAETAKDYETHIELAKRCISDRNFDSAAAHLNQAIAEDASKPEAFNLKGALLEIDGQIDEALKQYRVAYHLEPTYAPARENLERIVVQHERGPISMDDKS